MSQDIYNIDGTATGLQAIGDSIILTSGQGDTQSRRTGQNDLPNAAGMAITTISGMYQHRFDDPTYYG